MSQSIRLCTLIAAALLVSACGSSMRETLGVSKKAPDEFKVVSRPPLSVPPEFSLRPPSAPGEAPEVEAARQEARALVLGHDDAADAGTLMGGDAETSVVTVTSSSLGNSAAEAEFLRNAGADQADDSVRRKLYREAARKEAKQDSTWKKLTTFPEKGDPTVKADAEKERILKNKAEGKPVTEGETPETSDRDTGVLGRLLGD